MEEKHPKKRPEITEPTGKQKYPPSELMLAIQHWFGAAWPRVPILLLQTKNGGLTSVLS